VSAIRAVDALAARSLAAWHPVVARLLCSREHYLTVARAQCFRQGSADAAPLVAFLRDAGDWGAVETPPEIEGGCTSFCPACQAQFRDRAAGCPDCRVPLRAHTSVPGCPVNSAVA
jgi:hypothetical protein